MFVLVLGSGPLIAATREQTAYAAAKADFRSEFWSRAELELAQFRQKYPESTNAPEAVLLQAQAAFQQGKLLIAIGLLADSNHLAKAGSLADQYVYWTGEAQFKNGDLTNAAETFVSLAREYPGSSLRLPAVVSAAAAYAQLGQWRQHDALLEETNGVFQQAARLDPGKDLVLDGQLSLENSKYQQRDFAGTAAAYDVLTNHWHLLNQVQQCQATYLLYRARMELGDFPAALAAATNLVQIARTPANQDWLATGWASKGEVLERMNQLPDAIQAWQNNLTNAPLYQQRQAVLKIAEQEMVQGQLTNAEDALTNFLAQFTNADFADIALLTAGELHLKDYAARPAATNQLLLATNCFDQFFATFTNSPLVGKAYLDRGWCGWLAGNITDSLDDFREAAARLAPSADLAVARFKTGDALFALTNYAGALENYQAVLNDFTNFPAVAETLGDRALYQSLRACLGMNDLPRASAILEQVLKRFPASSLAPESALLYGEGLASETNELAARGVFQQFLAQFPDSPLRPQVEFAIARTYELEQNWPAAIAGYQTWLTNFPTNGLRPQIFYALARVNSEAGNETNAFGLFTQFVTQYPDSRLAPQAQLWVADYFFNLGGTSATNYVNAERNYKMLYQNTNWLDSPLIYWARLMAGRAAAARQGNREASDYFSTLETDTNCPTDLRMQAAFAHGNALMQMQLESPDTNNTLAYFSIATNVFFQIIQRNPTNELGARAWGKIGECEFQLGEYVAATNAYSQVLNTNLAADISLRSQAQIGIGLALEKMAATMTGTNQTAVLQEALNNYLDVFYTWTGKNLRDGETADQLWVKKAGLQALSLIDRLGTPDPDGFIDQMETLLPQLKNYLEKIRASLSQSKD